MDFFFFFYSWKGCLARLFNYLFINEETRKWEEHNISSLRSKTRLGISSFLLRVCVV
jgi:hypothetical protein